MTIAIGQAFGGHGAAGASRPGVTTGDRSWTFAELAAARDRLAARLEQEGLRPGRIVALALPGSAAFVVAQLALWRLGAVPALVSSRYEAGEWQAISSEVGGLDLLTERETAGRWLSDPTSVPHRVSALESAGLDRSLVFHRGPDGPLHPELALVKYSSGTTGRPKGIALTADQVAAEARQVTDTLGLTSESQILCPVPLSHSYGFDLGILPLVAAGATLRIEEILNPRRLLRQLSDAPPTLFLGTPSLLRILWQAAPDATPALDQIPWILSCTAPLGPRLVRDFHERFGAVICQHYGSSETGAVANHRPLEVLARPRAVGRPMKGVSLRIVDESGAECPVGSEGLVQVTSPALARGYVSGDPGAVRFRRDGYLIGDVGRMDAGGFLEVLGRRDGVINVGGLKVSPREVAEALEEHPQVGEAVVYPVVDEASGEVPEAMVAGPITLREDELREFLVGRLADYKRPRRIVICRALPRGPSGKVQLPRSGDSR